MEYIEGPSLSALIHARGPLIPSQVKPEAGIPKQLDDIVMCCLQKTAELRFQNGAALCAALQSVPGYRPLRSMTLPKG
jgi:hypothetical protein